MIWNVVVGVILAYLLFREIVGFYTLNKVLKLIWDVLAKHDGELASHHAGLLDHAGNIRALKADVAGLMLQARPVDAK